MAYGKDRRFTKMQAAQPGLSDTMLLNANNRTQLSSKPDVVVVGAGIVGLCYAIQLKKDFPDLQIAVFEKSPAPCQKIGESTLSSFSRFVNGALVPVDYFFRLFALKDGLQFYCLDEDGRRVTCEDVGGHDVSFQMDRRVSELFFTMWAQHMGIHVLHGVDADFKVEGQNEHDQSSIGAPEVILKKHPDLDGSSVQPKVACDASGFSRRLTSKFGRKELFEGWNCDAYWGYFKERAGGKVEDRVANWDYPATNHMCFPEGWGWFIKLMSWHHAPLANLMDFVAYLIRNASGGVPADQIPCTQELSKMFGCPYEYITSIGWAVRNDYQFPSDLQEYGSSESEQKFKYFQRKYPTLERHMNEVYELLPNYYGRTYFVRKALAYRSPVVAGKGWFAVGNSAGFTNPLISPGMNAGIETAYLAAALTKEVLEAPRHESETTMARCADRFQTWSHEYMLPSLHRMNRYWYNMFRDHRLFEALIPAFWATGVGAVDDIQFQVDSVFSEADLGWLVGSGLDCFQDFAKQVLSILEPQGRAASSSKRVTGEEVEKVQSLSEETLIQRAAMFPQNRWGCYLRKYNDRLQRVVGKVERNPGGTWSATHCIQCNVWIHDKTEKCPQCGTWQNGGWFSLEGVSWCKLTYITGLAGKTTTAFAHIFSKGTAAWADRGLCFLLGALWTLMMLAAMGFRNPRLEAPTGFVDVFGQGNHT